jgi:hypothetical protein
MKTRAWHVIFQGDVVICLSKSSIFVFFSFPFRKFALMFLEMGWLKAQEGGLKLGNHHRCDKWGFEGCCMDGPCRNMWVRGPGIKEGSGGALTHFIYFYWSPFLFCSSYFSCSWTISVSTSWQGRWYFARAFIWVLLWLGFSVAFMY